jgi:hypothetical protein
VAAVAVGDGLEEHRSLSRTRERGGATDALADDLDVEPVELIARHADAECADRHVGHCRRPRDGCAHRVEVVLDEEDDRQLVELREAESFEERTLVRGAVAEEADADAAPPCAA